MEYVPKEYVPNEYVEVQDVRVPALGLGTWQMTGRECREAVEAGLAIGYRHIDTAQMYGNEAEVGAAIGAGGIARDELFVTTKIASDVITPSQVRRSTEASLEKLGLDHVDLLLVHQPVAERRLVEVLVEMEAMRSQGLVSGLGLSNHTVAELEEAMGVAPLLAIQVEYHPFRNQDAQLEAARRHQLLFQAYSPLARGGGVRDRTVLDQARRLGVTPAQLTLRWLLDQPNVAPIPKAAQRHHLEENWAALDVTIDDEARAALDGLTSRDQSAREVGVG